MRILARRISSVIRQVLKKNTSVSSCQILFQKEGLGDLPGLRDILPLRVEEMDVNDQSQVMSWISIINQSFSRDWTSEYFGRSITEHRIYDVCGTYLLLDGTTPVGVISEGVFRKNRDVGVTHYLGLDKKYAGHGLGKYLILFALHKLRERGVNRCEGESSFNHVKSLFIHFDFGFKPKARPDYWNTPTSFAPHVRWLANVRLRSLFKEWKLRRKSGQ